MLTGEQRLFISENRSLIDSGDVGTVLGKLRHTTYLEPYGKELLAILIANTVLGPNCFQFYREPLQQGNHEYTLCILDGLGVLSFMLTKWKVQLRDFGPTPENIQFVSGQANRAWGSKHDKLFIEIAKAALSKNLI